jgi:hypothetical protein
MCENINAYSCANANSNLYFVSPFFPLLSPLRMMSLGIATAVQWLARQMGRRMELEPRQYRARLCHAPRKREFLQRCTPPALLS